VTRLEQPPPPVDATTQATLLIDEFIAALVNSRIYEVDHPRVQGSLQRLKQLLVELANTTGENTVQLGSADGLVVFQERPLLGASIGASRLLATLQQWGSGGLSLGRNASTSELQELLTSMVARPRPGWGYAELNQQLETRQCHEVRLLPPFREGKAYAGASGKSIRVGIRFYQTVIDLLQNITVNVSRGGRIDFAPVQAQAEEVLKQLDAKNEPLLGLARQDQYDAFTFGHSLRVTVLSMNFAKSLTEDRDLLIRIGTAALLHDVGKSLIPFEILHSPQNLTAEERREMNRHAELGAECLLGHHDSDPLAIVAAFGHHRGPDGKGYPNTAHEHHAEMVTNIVKICDVFEALTAARPYKHAMSPIRAYRVMIAMGERLDQRLLKKFIHRNGIYPVGQLVTLSTGEIAMVHDQSSDPLAPVVALVEDAEGQVFDEDCQEILDLSAIECCGARKLLGELAPHLVLERTERQQQEERAERAAEAEREALAARRARVAAETDPWKWD
jgi:HD-GYP domain-containing protein (c-di-GMP phosphodiesterase class II)